MASGDLQAWSVQARVVGDSAFKEHIIQGKYPLARSDHGRA